MRRTFHPGVRNGCCRGRETGLLPGQANPAPLLYEVNCHSFNYSQPIKPSKIATHTDDSRSLALIYSSSICNRWFRYLPVYLHWVDSLNTSESFSVVSCRVSLTGKSNMQAYYYYLHEKQQQRPIGYMRPPVRVGMHVCVRLGRCILFGFCLRV